MKRSGFTLVELLVVIAIIGTLVGLLLPAVQAARESGRKTQCLNNIRNLGLALQSYHEQFKKFPPSSTWLDEGDVEIVNTTKLRANWVILILPFLEQQPLRDQFDLQTDPTPIYITENNTINPGQNNAQARGTVLSVMLCPSDTYNRTPYSGPQGDNWARGNYGANGGLGYLSKTQMCNEITIDGVAAGCAAFADSPGWQSPLKGIMGANVSMGTEGVRDGTSHTIIIGEIRTGLIPSDPRGVWAMSGAGPSSLWAHGLSGGDNGLNASKFNDATEPNDDDDIGTCGDLLAAYPNGAEDLVGLGMPCNSENRPNWQQTIRSSHAMGAHIALADGSARFLNDSVSTGFKTPTLFTDRTDTANYNIDKISIWDRLQMANDRQPVPADQVP